MTADSAAPGSVSCSEVREYGVSHADLERLLPRLLHDVEPIRTADGFLFPLAGGRAITLVPGPERERRLAGLRLPCTEIRFEFVGLSQSECESFRARFGRVFHKGGG